MKKIITAFVFTLLTLSVFGQKPDLAQEDKIKWYISVKCTKDNEADIIIKAVLADHWHVFSLTHDPMKADFTGTTTKFVFEPNSAFKLIGSPLPL